ncbi:MAG TPA: Gfo/Idh/MocA family oxidoreductase [Planctomycetaceae bacterium]|nr:Gfo/Idh/MocA family oxidoreductase [Planctomycetaceae bacterium]
MHSFLNRREFLSTAVLAGAGATALATNGQAAQGDAPGAVPAESRPRHRVERPGIGAIGLRYQGSVITRQALAHGDLAAVCDVDRHVREQARASFGSTARIYEDYRDLLAQQGVDVVLIATPDHWHTPMVLDACRAGKDVYCEKPPTLTVDEGKLIERVVGETGRIVQVGSWERSDHRFRLAAEIVRQGRIGPLQRVDVVLGKNVTGGPFATASPPPNLNWDLWQGQTPDVPFAHERCHYTFRWWYEYSGGQLTDWGAHHVDIAQWAIGSQPVAIDGRATFPDVSNGYNVATDFHVSYRFANGVEMTVADTGRNGILFTGSEGRLFVNRGGIEGVPVERLESEPLPREQWTLYAHDDLQQPPRMGKLDAIVNHMANFFDCVESRRTPLSDVHSQHQAATTCHLGNISMRLGRSLAWDPEREEFVNDAEANRWLRREPRKGFEFGV